MVAELIPEAYDIRGHAVLRPDYNKRFYHPTFPLGRYVSRPLTVECSSIVDVWKFLRTCRMVSDEKQFGREDYWQPPDEFEKTKKGDCDCFAFWTWRQLLNMHKDARIVFGITGARPTGHAWVQYCERDRCFLVDPTLWPLGLRIPRFTTLFYVPRYSVSWDGSKLRYFHHREQESNLNFMRNIGLLPEWLWIWSRFWIRGLFFNLPLRLCRAIYRQVFRRSSPMNNGGQNTT